MASCGGAPAPCGSGWRRCGEPACCLALQDYHRPSAALPSRPRGPGLRTMGLPLRQPGRGLGVRAVPDLPRDRGLRAVCDLRPAGQEPDSCYDQPIRRQLRHCRRRGVAVQLTDRDRGCAPRPRAVPAGPDVGPRRLRLRRRAPGHRRRPLRGGSSTAKYLAILPPEAGGGERLPAWPAGKAHLAEGGGKPGRVPRGGLEHHLAIVETWVTVAGLRRPRARTGPARLGAARAVRRRRAAGRARPLPRSSVWGEHLHAVAVEVDRGTESLAVLNRKLEAYRSLWAQAPGLFGYRQFGIAVACHTPARRAQLSLSTQESMGGSACLVGRPEDPSVRSAQAVRRVERLPLLPPLSSRGGEER